MSNVFKKLARARKLFLDKHVQQSGKNMNLEFLYFELKDIVPEALTIFDEVGICTKTDFGQDDKAIMTVIDCDNPESQMTFSAPWMALEPIQSNSGKKVTNEIQALGSTITYMRRYLYMMVLDIVEQDAINPSLTKDPKETIEKKASKVKNTPATAEERAEAKQKLTGSKKEESKPKAEKSETKEEGTVDPNAPADEKDIEALKDVCRRYKDIDEDFVVELAIKTNGFTEISKVACEQVIVKMEELIKTEGKK